MKIYNTSAEFPRNYYTYLLRYSVRFSLARKKEKRLKKKRQNWLAHLYVAGRYQTPPPPVYLKGGGGGKGGGGAFRRHRDRYKGLIGLVRPTREREGDIVREKEIARERGSRYGSSALRSPRTNPLPPPPIENKNNAFNQES